MDGRTGKNEPTAQRTIRGARNLRRPARGSTTISTSFPAIRAPAHNERPPVDHTDLPGKRNEKPFGISFALNDRSRALLQII